MKSVPLDVIFKSPKRGRNAFFEPLSLKYQPVVGLWLIYRNGMLTAISSAIDFKKSVSVFIYR